MFHTPAPQSRVQQGFSTHPLQPVFQLSFPPSRLSVLLSQSVPLPVLRLSLPVAHPHPCTDSLLFGRALFPLSGVCPSCAHLPVPSLSLISFTSPSVSAILICTLVSACSPFLPHILSLSIFLFAASHQILFLFSLLSFFCTLFSGSLLCPSLPESLPRSFSLFLPLTKFANSEILSPGRPWVPRPLSHGIVGTRDVRKVASEAWDGVA